MLIPNTQEGQVLWMGAFLQYCWKAEDKCLCSQDHVLIELTQAGLKGSTEGSESYEEDPYLVVNPNYLLED